MHQFKFIGVLYTIKIMAKRELRRRAVTAFAAQHEAGRAEEWDDQLRFMFEIAHPEIEL